MIDKLSTFQIVVNGNFEPFYVGKTDILQLSHTFSNFLLFPKEVTEQRIEFNPQNQQQNITINRSFDLVSANEKCTLQVRPDVIVYNYNFTSSERLSSVIEVFIRLLKTIEKQIKFQRAVRLGAVLRNQNAYENIEKYKEENHLEVGIVEHNSKIVRRENLGSISELVNFVCFKEFFSKELGVPQDLVNITYDINTLADKDAPRFSVQEIENFLNDVQSLLVRE